MAARCPRKRATSPRSRRSCRRLAVNGRSLPSNASPPRSQARPALSTAARCPRMRAATDRDSPAYVAQERRQRLRAALESAPPSEAHGSSMVRSSTASRGPRTRDRGTLQGGRPRPALLPMAARCPRKRDDKNAGGTLVGSGPFNGCALPSKARPLAAGASQRPLAALECEPTRELRQQDNGRAQPSNARRRSLWRTHDSPRRSTAARCPRKRATKRGDNGRFCGSLNGLALPSKARPRP